MKVIDDVEVVQPVVVFGALGTSTNGTIRLLRVDSTGQLYVRNDNVPVSVDDGDAFKADWTEAVATDGTTELTFATDTSVKYSYMNMEIQTDADTLDVKLYEGVARSEATTVTVYNKNRLSATTSATTVLSAPTAVTVTSTILIADVMAGNHAVNYGTFKLNVSKIYYFLCTPTGVGTKQVSIRLNWVDRTDFA